MPDHGSRRIGRPSASTLSAAQMESVVRRMGFVLSKAHEEMMRNLLQSGQVHLAEDVNDSLKPLVDALLHFEITYAEGNDDGTP